LAVSNKEKILSVELSKNLQYLIAYGANRQVPFGQYGNTVAD